MAATLRFALGTGSLFAFPGSPFGALVVGLVYLFVKRDEAALSEPIRTVLVGAPLGALLVSPFLDVGAASGVGVLVVSFALSSIPGAILGYLLLKALRRAGRPAERAAGARQGVVLQFRAGDPV